MKTCYTKDFDSTTKRMLISNIKAQNPSALLMLVIHNNSINETTHVYKSLVIRQELQNLQYNPTRQVE